MRGLISRACHFRETTRFEEMQCVSEMRKRKSGTSSKPSEPRAFTVRPYRSKRLDEYSRRMSTDRLGTIVDDNVKDVLLAQGYSTDDAPRSVYKVEKLYEALTGFAPGTVPDFQMDEHVQSGLALARASFARKSDEPRLSVLPFTPATIDLITSNPGGSPGLTNYGCTKAESKTRALERGLQSLKGVKQSEPCLAFARTQFNDKTRLVWGFPYSETAIEGLVAYPLLQRFKGGSTPMAFSMTTGALGTKLRTASYHKEWAYSLDMSQFDATLSRRLIYHAFKILETWFDPKEVEPVSGCTVAEIFEHIRYYFIHTTIVMPDKKLYIGKDHGVPSGSFFTQMIDSVANVIICGTIASRFSLHVDKHDVFVLGDDLLFWSNRRVDLDKIAKYANSVFGVKVHGAEKSAIFHYDDVIHFLGRDWANGLPTLSQDEILKRMIYPERFRRYPKEPEEIQRQVRMLLLSFAATYREAWRIAYKCIDPSDSNIHNGCSNVDVTTYMNGGRQEQNPDHLSGLMRYKMKYGLAERDKFDIPNTALQYWL